MKKNTPLFFFLFLANVLLGQTSTIRGVLLDDSTTEPLIGATIISGEVGTVTEYDGSYVLELENGTHEISFSYVGYNTITRTVEVAGDMQLDISLGTVDRKKNTCSIFEYSFHSNSRRNCWTRSSDGFEFYTWCLRDSKWWWRW